MAWYLINEIPGVKKLRYLELGTQRYHTFDKIECRDKTGVDILHPAMFQMSTDEFFQWSNKDDLYDLIFIDACHVYDFVVRDYLNSVQHLTPGGTLFIHDLFPPDEDHTSPKFCGDGFKFLCWLVENTVPVWTLDCDFGLTVFFDPQPIIPPGYVESYSYTHFLSTMRGVKRFSKDEMVKIIKQIYIERGGVRTCLTIKSKL